MLVIGIKRFSGRSSMLANTPSRRTVKARYSPKECRLAPIVIPSRPSAYVITRGFRAAATVKSRATTTTVTVEILSCVSRKTIAANKTAPPITPAYHPALLLWAIYSEAVQVMSGSAGATGGFFSGDVSPATGGESPGLYCHPADGACCSESSLISGIVALSQGGTQNIAGTKTPTFLRWAF